VALARCGAHHVPRETIPSIELLPNLKLRTCPHCGIAWPLILPIAPTPQCRSTPEGNQRLWGVYVCSTCAGIIAAEAPKIGAKIVNLIPAIKDFSEEIPALAREFLRQAYESLHAPAGAIMLSASAIDAMLKIKNFTEGNLKNRIDQAVSDNLLTKAMGEWAHHVRLNANDQRHADINAGLPTEIQARQSVEFAEALAEILFVLPARVSRGIEKAKDAESSV
jgi:hypothetical protein